MAKPPFKCRLLKADQGLPQGRATESQKPETYLGVQSTHFGGSALQYMHGPQVSVYHVRTLRHMCMPYGYLAQAGASNNNFHGKLSNGLSHRAFCCRGSPQSWLWSEIVTSFCLEKALYRLSKLNPKVPYCTSEAFNFTAKNRQKPGAPLTLWRHAQNGFGALGTLTSVHSYEDAHMCLYTYTHTYL